MKKILPFYLPILVIICCACIAAIAGGIEKGGSINLECKFAEGSSYRYTIKQQQNMSTNSADYNISISQNSEIACSYTMAGNEGNNIKLSLSFDRLKLKWETDHNPVIDYNSEDSSKNNPAYAGMTARLHKTIGLVLNEHGKLMAVNGIKNLGANNVDKNPLGDSGIVALAEQCFHIYPGKPVKPGDTWGNTYSSSSGLVMDNTFKLISISNGKAHVTLNTKISSRAAKEDDEVQIKISGSQTGRLDIEIASGLVLSCNLSQLIKGDIQVKDAVSHMKVDGELSISGEELK